MKEKEIKDLIVESLKDISLLRLKVYDNTKEAFEMLKQVLQDIVEEYNQEALKLSEDKRLQLTYKERGSNIVSLQVASELLVFNFHSNIFQFNREHEIWNNPYVRISPANAFSGMITIYNFLADSFRYNRLQDLGYMVGRIFVNRQNHFIVEGKRQIGFKQREFGKAELKPECLKLVVERSINYALNFDLLVPPYDDIKIVSVAQMQETEQSVRVRTGKRLGFRFNSDDV
ncbi:MAG: hypothetical protein N4A32_03125 [Marinifilaceae bacterium]|jgi:hypothetical protein|nr:hypothetical protein [Marinifilaceae bacterium]